MIVLELNSVNWKVLAPLLGFKVWYLFSAQLWVFPRVSSKWFHSLKRSGVEMTGSCSPKVFLCLTRALCSSCSGQPLHFFSD